MTVWGWCLRKLGILTLKPNPREIKLNWFEGGVGKGGATDRVRDTNKESTRRKK